MAYYVPYFQQLFVPINKYTDNYISDTPQIRAAINKNLVGVKHIDNEYIQKDIYPRTISHWQKLFIKLLWILYQLKYHTHNKTIELSKETKSILRHAMLYALPFDTNPEYPYFYQGRILFFVFQQYELGEIFPKIDVYNNFKAFIPTNVKKFPFLKGKNTSEYNKIFNYNIFSSNIIKLRIDASLYDKKSFIRPIGLINNTQTIDELFASPFAKTFLKQYIEAFKIIKIPEGDHIII